VISLSVAATLFIAGILTFRGLKTRLFKEAK
jgi:hypothetical protein